MTHPVQRMAAVTLVAGGLAACGSSEAKKGSDNEYPVAARTNFMNACVAQPGARSSACQCAFDRIQVRLSYSDFKTADAAARRGRDMQKKARDVFADAIDKCRR
jgi:hypothetical protein